MLDFFKDLTCLSRLNTYKNKVTFEEKSLVIKLCSNSELNHKGSKQVGLPSTD